MQSSLRLLSSPTKRVKKTPIIIPDREHIAKVWNEPLQNIWVHDSINLAQLDLKELSSGNVIWDVDWILSKNLLLADFFYIERENALPGGLMPKGTQLLTYNGQRITPILPLNPWLLTYLTPEDLISKVQLESVETPDGKQVRVIMDLPLSGTGDTPRNYRISKDYLIKDENCIQEVPVLELWPNFRAEGWQEYYAFYYDGDYGDDAMQINFADAKDQHTFKEGIGNYSLVRFDQFPSFISCQGNSKVFQGVIILGTPPKVGTSNINKWTIGVDFSPFFTNVYINRNQSIVERLSIPPLHLQITASWDETRRPVLMEYFLAAMELTFPIPSVLTTRQASQYRPILDGRTYIPRSSREFNDQSDWIHTNLKWSPEKIIDNQLFIHSLILQISAFAATRNVREIQWSLSFPSNFSRFNINSYVREWRTTTEIIASKTGIKQLCSDIQDHEYLRSENSAFAQYFADYEQLNLVNTTCIYMANGMSDISIWQENTQIYQCSLQLAEQELLSQLLALNPTFLRRFRLDENDRPRVNEARFFACLDVLLREKLPDWLRTTRDHVSNQPEVKGFFLLMALGIAGMYYYVGILLQVLHETGIEGGDRKYSLTEITPTYVGGKDSHLLHWLTEGGKFNFSSQINDVLSRMISCGSGFEDTEIRIHLSKNPGDEVACGLVLSETTLKGSDFGRKDPVISGEECLFKGQKINWDTFLPEDQIKDSMNDFKVANLDQLRKFVFDFHDSLVKLRIDVVSPIEGYKLSLDPNENSRLWRETEKELTAMLVKMRSQSDDIRLEPPFILGLKALLKYLGREWANKWKDTN